MSAHSHWVAIAISLAATLAGCSTGAVSSGGSSGGRSLGPAPAFSARELGGTRSVSLQGLHGRTVLLTSWATWCVDCRAELPAIERLAQTYKARGLTVIGVNINAGGNDAGPLRYVHDHGLTFRMLHDTSNAFQVAFNAVGVPESALIDRDGRLRAVWPGALDVARAMPTIDRALRP